MHSTPRNDPTPVHQQHPVKPGDPVFVYNGPGLATRLEGWAVSIVELFFGDGRQAALTRAVAVFRDHDGQLDIAASVSALEDVEESWHLVSPDGEIVGGGPCTTGPSQTQAELEAERDSGLFAFQRGSTAVHGIPATARRSPSLDQAPAQDYPANGGFTAARGGTYRWLPARPDVTEHSLHRS